MKYALVIGNVIDTISYPYIEGWSEVPDDVFAGFVREGDKWVAPQNQTEPSPDEGQDEIRELEA